MTACVIGLSSDEMEMQDLAEQEQAECQQRVAELLEQVINYCFHFKKNIFILNQLLRNSKCISFWSHESKYHDVLKKKKDDCVSILQYLLHEKLK